MNKHKYLFIALICLIRISIRIIYCKTDASTLNDEVYFLHLKYKYKWEVFNCNRWDQITVAADSVEGCSKRTVELLSGMPEVQHTNHSSQCICMAIFTMSSRPQH